MPKITELHTVSYTKLEFNHGATMSYGKRVGFVDIKDRGLLKTNPRDEIGKLGVRRHTGISKLFHSTITLKVQTATDGGTDKAKYRKIHLNKGSTIKWLNSQLSDGDKVDKNTSRKEIANIINNLGTTLKEARAEQEAKAVQADEKTYKANLTNTPLKGIIQSIKASFWHTFTKYTNSSWNRLRFRFGLQIKEKTIDQASKILAVDTYKTARDRVPAYRDLVNDTGPNKLTSFDEVPITSKDNYIKPALKAKEETSLYLDGEIPINVKRDTSTGTSGPSTPWYRGPDEQKHVEKMSTYAARAILGDQPYYFINGFAMGPWATGVTATLAANNNPQSSVAVIGPNIPEIYAAIKEQARIFGTKYPIGVAGYPPHLRAVIELAVAEGFPLHDYNIIGVVGGEAMSEDLRDLLVEQRDADGNITRTGFKQCYSSYGASDLDINIGYESDFEIELRKKCHENTDLAEDLFGKNEFKPMIFHYDPLNYHIESDEQHKLYYTCVRDDRISPRVRYDLGDIGKTTPVSDVLATLKKHGIELKNKPNLSLPLLFIWGRQGAQISFRGCKVAPENLGETIRKVDASNIPGLNESIAHYGFYQHADEGKTVTEILIEFNEDADFDIADDELLKQLLEKLAIVNTDFVSQIQNCPDDEKPVLRVFKKGESPMDIQQKKYPMRKKQYIFAAGDEFIPAHDTIADKGKVISLV